MDDIEHIQINIADYQPHPRNYNEHPDPQVGEIAESLRVFGQVKPVVVWREWYIAGHGVVLGARHLGWTQLQAVRLPADWPEYKALAYLAADNELARGASPNLVALAALAKDVQAQDADLGRLAAGGEEGLRRLSALMKEPAGEDAGPQIDRAEELREKWGVELGQLWQLGEHRLICGDCTEPAVVERVLGGEKADLLLSDPPYGKLKIFNATGAVGNAGSNLAKVKTYGAYPGHEAFKIELMLKALEGHYAKAIIWGGNNFTDILPVTQSWLVWDKRAGKTVFYADCELAWSDMGITAKVFDFTWQGMIREGDPIERMHPTQKPVELYEWCLGLAGDVLIVIDPTSGSASCLIACERLGRRCRAVEISPAYCAVAIQRWVDMTGGEPVMLSD